MVAGVPLSGDGEALVDGLLESELASGALRGCHHVFREVITAEADARSTAERLRKLSIGVIARVVVALAHRGKIRHRR